MSDECKYPALSMSGKTYGHYVCQCGADLGDCPLDEIDAVFAEHKRQQVTNPPTEREPFEALRELRSMVKDLYSEGHELYAIKLNRLVDALAASAEPRYHCTYCDGSHHETQCSNRCEPANTPAPHEHYTCGCPVEYYYHDPAHYCPRHNKPIEVSNG